MKPIQLLLIACTLFSLTGCHKVFFALYDVKKPALENETTLKSYAFGIGLDTSNMYTVSYPAYLKAVSRGFPEGLIFTASGNYIEYKATDTACNSGLFSFIEKLNKYGFYQPSNSFQLNNEISMLRTLKGQPVKAFDPKSYDFLLLIYWVRFLGKLNIDHVKEWQDLASANPNAHIKTILVNLDVQENWDPPTRDEILHALKKAVR